MMDTRLRNRHDDPSPREIGIGEGLRFVTGNVRDAVGGSASCPELPGNGRSRLLFSTTCTFTED